MTLTLLKLELVAFVVNYSDLDSQPHALNIKKEKSQKEHMLNR